MSQPKLTEKQKYWQGHLNVQRQAGVSRKQYCAQHGLNQTHMDHYASCLRRKFGPPKKSEDFVRIAPPTPQKVVVRLSSGVSIECPADSTLLKEVLKSTIESN